MKYRIYVYTIGDQLLYVSEHDTPELARWWMYAWIERGFIPIANTNAAGEEYVIPANSRTINNIFFQVELGPEPLQTLERERTVGLDNGT